jgi:hypothetical protein
MGYLDELEDNISNHSAKVINAKSADEARAEYIKFGKLLLQRLSISNKNTSFTKEEMKAEYCHAVLDRVLYIYDDEVEVKPDIFVNFLKSDAGLTQFCKEHMEHDGIIGALNYRLQIGNKKAVLEQALQLASQG